MRIEDFSDNEMIEIVDVSLIEVGENYWEDGDLVQIKAVDVDYNRIEVWDKGKYLSEFIYDHELDGIKKVVL